ncbi:hypothetical protein PFISCL1PPCAC_20197, partial [Pristionchus fissidentatus]
SIAASSPSLSSLFSLLPLLYPNMLRSFSRSESGCITRHHSSMSSSSLPSPTEISDPSAPFVAVLVNLCVDRLENLPVEVADLHLISRVTGDNRILYTSQKLEGEEDEINDKIGLIVDDIGRSLAFEVIGKNKWRKDNVIDRGTIELAQCRLFKWQELSLVMESVTLSCSIQVHPITGSQKEEFCKRWGSAGVRVEHGRSVGRANTAECSIINIVLIKGFNIGDPFDPPDSAVKFKLGTEKYKSRVIMKSIEPEWGESFEMKLPKGVEILEIQVVCRRKKNLISTGELHLSGIPRDKAIRQEVILGPKSSLDIIVSVPAGHTHSSVLANVAPAYDTRFNLSRTFGAIGDVGEVVIKIIRAENVQAMDLGGKSDPFAILRMGNLRVRTHTHYSTLFPEWNRLFVLPVEDLHAVIDVSLFDEDSTGKADFLGRISVPLLEIVGWERRWFVLKDRKLLKPTKGRVLLEMRLQYNMIRAVARTFTPREKEYLVVTPKFKPSVLKASVNEIRRFGSSFTPIFQSIDDVMRWKRPGVSFLSMMIYIFVILYIEVFHLPIFLIALILNASWNSFISSSEVPPTPPPTPKENDSNTSILSISDTLLELQETLAFITLLIQRFRNASDMTSPWLTCLAIFVLSAATVLIYLLPLRYLVLAWGINKFTKRLRKPPNFVDNNELLDFLSRVPSDRQLKEWAEPTPADPFTILPKKSVDTKQ